MIWYYLIAAVHVIVCTILILVVLLQSGKGADLAGAFGGGGTQTVFGSRGPATFLSKITTIAAVLFMITCLSLSLLGEKQDTSSIMDTTTGKATPAKTALPKPAEGQAPAAAPTPDEIKKIQEQIESKAKPEPGPTPASAPPEQPAPAAKKAPAEKKAP